MSQDEPEYSESGQPIYRHKPRERDWMLPESPAEHLEEIESHLQKYVGDVKTVFHELVSDLVHLDVLWIAPTRETPYHVLVTSGVSDLPMNVPEGLEHFRRAELMIALPPHWPLTQDAFEDEGNYWPIRWLKTIGRLPHEYDTWIGMGHTIPNLDPPQPIANTGFTGFMLTIPYWLPPEFFELKLRSGESIWFLMLMPLYPEEMDLKLKLGREALEDRFDERKVGFILDTRRPNVAKKRSWFGR